MAGGAVELQLMLRGLNESALTQGAKASVTTTRRGLANFGLRLDKIITLSEHHRALAIALDDASVKQWPDIRAQVEVFLDSAENFDFNDIPQMIALGKLVANAGNLADQFETLAASIRSTAQRLEAQTVRRVGVVTAGLVILITVLLVALALSAVRPVDEQLRFISTVEPHSDLTRSVKPAAMSFRKWVMG